MQTTYYKIPSGKNINMKVALISDLHNNPHEHVIEALKKEKPRMIFIAGDLMEDLSCDRKKVNKENEIGFDFLRKAVKIAPVFYSLGNHERNVSIKHREKAENTGARLLDNEYVEYFGMRIGGLSSGHARKRDLPDTAWLDGFTRFGGYKILLCHHPEYYNKYVKELKVDLTLSGHAHGGHWRIANRGVFAPGQGLFPKYTSGVHENRLVISRGLGDHTFIPRIGNPIELVIIDII